MLNTQCEHVVPGYFLNRNVEYPVWTRCTWIHFEPQCWIPSVSTLYLDTFWTAMLNTQCEHVVPGYFLNRNVEYPVWTRCTWILFEPQCWIPSVNTLYLDTFWTAILNTQCEHVVPGYFLNRNVEYPVWTRCTWIVFEPQCWIPSVNTLYLDTFWTAILNTQCEHVVLGYFLNRNVEYPVWTRCTWILFEPQCWIPSVSTLYLATQKCDRVDSTSLSLCNKKQVNKSGNRIPLGGEINEDKSTATHSKSVTS